MRFIKKGSFHNIKELSDVYKEFELYTDRGDFTNKATENLEILKEVYEKNGAIVKAIHCPSSKYKTSLDKESELSTNYMSWCEILENEEESKLFISICEFAKSIVNIYNNNNNSLLEKENEIEDEENEIEDEENESIKEESNFNIIVILHTGCAIGCHYSNEFKCHYNLIDMDKCIKEIETPKIDIFTDKIKKMNNIKIAFENITPYQDQNIGNNSGYGYENFILAERLNKKYDTKIFGVVIDFCHIIATHSILKCEIDVIEYINNYLNGIGQKRKEIIDLFHLSKYDNASSKHGGIFSDSENDENIIKNIRDWCLNNCRSIPITLEVADSQEVIKGDENFYKVMLEWSKLHILLKGKIDNYLYEFFEDLYKLYSLPFNKKTKKDVVEIAYRIRNNVLDKSKNSNKLFGFNNENQNLDIYLLQLQAYIYYIRYCNLAIDLLKKYEYLDCYNITDILSHYIFNDNLGEIRFDGLGSYYKIYWIKSATNLYRCYDGCIGGKNKEKEFSVIIKKCFEHICGNTQITQFLSFSKSFGRVMLKYFDPSNIGYTENNQKYNIEIIKDSPINCFCTNNKWVTLQEYQENKEDYSNFAIDFSDFYNGRGDSSKEASLKELYEKVCGKNSWRDSAIGSIYDQEVIVYNENNVNINRFYINIMEFIIIMVAYKIVIDLEIEDISLKEIIDEIVQNNSFYQNEFVKQYKTEDIKQSNVLDILSTVDFKYERKNRINYNNEGFSTFSKIFINWYKEISKETFYIEIIKEFKNRGGEDDVSKGI